MLRKRTTETNAGDLRVSSIPISTVRTHPRNVRMHSETNIAAIMRSIDKFGQRTPIVINAKRFVLKGNGTLESMRRLGLKTIQVVQVTHLSPEQELAYMLADNKTSDLSEFDFRGVSEILSELQELGMDLSVTGFEDFEVVPLIAADWTPTDPGEQPDGVVNEDSKYRVVFTIEQMRSITRAVTLWKSRAGQELHLPGILADICRDYVKRNGVKKRGG